MVLAFAGYSMRTTASQKVVVINPGHSLGYDTGAVGQYKCEAQINQELAGKIVVKLSQMGYKVYITHTTDESLQSYKLLDQEAGSHLKNVGDATNSVSPDLAMSIHHNSGGTSSSGTELYWSSYRTFDGDGVYTQPGMWSDGSGAYRDSSPCAQAAASQVFAQVIQNHLAGIPNLPFRKIVERDDYLPSHATCPCVLYEGGFVSNPAENAYLSSDAYLEDASTRIAEAINEYLGGPGAEPGSNSGATTPNPDSEVPVINSVGTSATITGDSAFTVSANASDNTGISIVRFATWTDANGQDDLFWIDGTNDGNGNWSARINVADHNFETGSYITHVYAYDTAGNFTAVVAPVVTVNSVGYSQTAGLTVQKLDSNMAVAFATRLGASNYKFAVWSEANGQDDLIWSDGIPQADESAKCVINRAEHNNDPGKYFVHCYTPDMRFVGGNEIDFGGITSAPLVANLNGNTIDIALGGINAPDGVQGVKFAVWSEINGIDDVVWYQAVPQNGNYCQTISLSNHRGSGNYCVHAYVTDNYGIDQFVGGAVVDTGTTSSAAPAGIGVNIGARAGNTVPVSITNVPGDLGVKVAVWSDDGGQDDLGWYDAARQGSDCAVGIDLGRHSGVGTYSCHVYTADPAGNMVFVGAYQFVINEPTASGVTAETPIMGNSGTTVNQLVNLYNELSPIPFPDYYVVRNVSLGEFCQMYVEEANAENVRADVAFCQAMLETGFLGFGGDVSISQFNFAGIGATGGGVPGVNFAAEHGDNANGIRMGIRAQIQHLKAYASTDPLNQGCVDPRFNLVNRGCAATIGGLTGRWAVDPTYHTKILNFIAQIK